MSGTSRRDKVKPADHVNLKVNSQDGKVVFFRIRRTTMLKKLLTAYCDKRFLDYSSTRFLIDGNKFGADKTPDELELEDGDEIDAVVEQLGGGYMVI